MCVCWVSCLIHSLNRIYIYLFISILSSRRASPRHELLSSLITKRMGNTVSATSGSGAGSDDIESMALKLDLYAQRIILKEVKFNSSLSDSGKCEKLIIITSEVLNRLPFRLISYMDRRHKLFSEKIRNV